MKKAYTVLLIAVLICIAGTAVFLIMSPDRVPVHYNFKGEIDRIGSKYENIIVPVIAAGIGIFFGFQAKQSTGKGMESNAKIMVYAGILTVLLLTVIGFYLMWKALKYAPGDERAVSPDMLNKLTSIGLGILLILLGNIMPKSTLNSAVGIRTKWSRANDTVWQKSQRFGGIASVVAGFVQIILSIFVPGMWNILVMTVIITVLAVICTVASYHFYREDTNRKNEEGA